MPELPDVEIYVEALRARILGEELVRVLVRGPFLLRSVTPPLTACFGKRVLAVRRVGKRIAIGVEDELWLVLHLMIAGRLHWKSSAKALAAFEFSNGVLSLTEAGTQHRASLMVCKGEEGLRALDPGGIEVLDADLSGFAQALVEENHTLKRALTDPRVFSGIGNAYSDEILHRARLSPVAQTQKLRPDEIERLYRSTVDVLNEWVTRMREEAEEGFPEGVTAFREEMAVHGKYGEPCPVCGTKIQRIRYASNETNYCPHCQTGDKLLADRGLSRLLGKDWPKTLEELETLKKR